MTCRILLAVVCALGAFTAFTPAEAEAQQLPQAYGRRWAHSYNTQDYNRFYHYPYVYYPQNFWSPDYYKTSNSLYHRYPPEMRVPVYNKYWFNYYPQGRRYHSGKHFMLDTF